MDFGTAKDLLPTDLNGPEFVGTHDFMSPEAVTGTDPAGTSSTSRDKTKRKEVVEAGPAADLWALLVGSIGHTPFWCPRQVPDLSSFVENLCRATLEIAC